MPYIKRTQRNMLDVTYKPDDVGELTYTLYRVCLDYLGRSDGRFADHAEVHAALVCAQQELYRRHTADYEDLKIVENGDIG